MLWQIKPLYHLCNKELPTILEPSGQAATPARPILLPDMTDETVDEKFGEMIEENRYREVSL